MSKADRAKHLGRLFLATLLLLLGSASVGTQAGDIPKGSPVGFGDYSSIGLPADATNLVQIVAAQGFNLGLREDGRVIGWGSGGNGALEIPPNLPKVRKIAAGYYFGMALLEDGTPRVWGGWGHVSALQIVTPPPNATNLIDIAGGMAHCLGLRADGTVVAWGNDIFDALIVPANVTNAISVAAGQAYSAVITTNKKVIGWGNRGYYGFNPPASLNDPRALAFGPFGSALGLNGDGRAYAWGNSSASQPPQFTNIFAIAAGSEHRLVAYGDGQVRGFGLNTSGQSAVPTNFPKVFAIAAGERHSVALTRAPVIIGVPNLNGGVLAGTDLKLKPTVLASDEWTVYWFFNGNALLNASSQELSITNIQAGHAGKYDMVASNSFGMTRTGEFQVDVWPAVLHWEQQPAHTTALPGSVATFFVDARGSEPIVYQWFHNGAPILNSNTNRLVIAAANDADAGAYWVIATNVNSTITSDIAQLAVSTPLFTKQPSNHRARANWTLELTAEVISPTPVTLHWFQNGELLLNETNSTLIIEEMTLAKAGNYQVRATNASGEVRSREARVQFLSNEFPTREPGVAVVWGNNMYGDLTEIYAQRDLVQTGAGRFHIAGLHADGHISIWGDNVRFQPFPAGATNLAAICSGDTHVIAVRRDGVPFAWGQALPSGIENVVGLAAGEFSSIFVKADGTIVTVGAPQPPGISNVVAAATGNIDHLAVLSDGRVFCWDPRNNSAPYFAIGITNAIAAAGGEWTQLALLEDGTVVGWSRSFLGPEVPQRVEGLSNVVEIAHYRWAQALLASGEVIPFGGIDAKIVPPGLRATTMSVSIGAGSGTSIIPILDRHPVNQESFSKGSATFESFARGPGNLVYQWFHNDSPIPGATNSTLQLADLLPRQAGRYHVRASNSHGAVESLTANLVVLGAPEIVSQPSIVQVAAGTEAVLEVQVASSLTTSFQWYFGNIPIPLARTNILRLSNVQAAHAGNYRVIVGNSYGSTDSSNIELVVTPSLPTFVTQPSNLSVRDGETAEFKVVVTGTEPFSFQWFHDNTPVPNATGPMLRIENVQQGKAGAYSVQVANLAGSVFSENGLLTQIVSAPAPQILPPFRLARAGRVLRFDAKLLAGTDTGQLTYQWRRTGTNLVGQTNSWLQIDSASSNDAGPYTVVVENGSEPANPKPRQRSSCRDGLPEFYAIGAGVSRRAARTDKLLLTTQRRD